MDGEHEEERKNLNTKPGEDEEDDDPSEVHQGNCRQEVGFLIPPKCEHCSQECERKHETH